MEGNCNKYIKFFRKYGVIILLFSIFLSALIFYYSYVSLGWWKFSNLASDWSNFGSYAAGIFTGITFLALLYQLYLTAKYQEKQDFERKLFFMLDLNQKKLEKLDIKSVYNKLHDRKNFYEIRGGLENNFSDKELYTDINAYFLNLYRILKFIDESGFNENLKYSSLVRSFLPRNLIFILSYHLCERDETYNKYIDYMNKFHFFEHINLKSMEFDFLYKLIFECPSNDRVKDILKKIVAKEISIDVLREINNDIESLTQLDLFLKVNLKKILVMKFKGYSLINLKFLEKSIYHYIFNCFDKSAFFDENSPYKFHKERYGSFIKDYKDSLKLEKTI